MPAPGPLPGPGTILRQMGGGAAPSAGRRRRLHRRTTGPACFLVQPYQSWIPDPYLVLTRPENALARRDRDRMETEEAWGLGPDYPIFQPVPLLVRLLNPKQQFLRVMSLGSPIFSHQTRVWSPTKQGLLQNWVKTHSIC